jgi:hypothetical protein
MARFIARERRVDSRERPNVPGGRKVAGDERSGWIHQVHLAAGERQRVTQVRGKRRGRGVKGSAEDPSAVRRLVGRREGDHRDPASRRGHDVRNGRYALNSVPQMRVRAGDRGPNEGGLRGIDLEHAALVIQENGGLEAKVFDDRLEGLGAWLSTAESTCADVRFFLQDVRVIGGREAGGQLDPCVEAVFEGPARSSLSASKRGSERTNHNERRRHGDELGQTPVEAAETRSAAI